MDARAPRWRARLVAAWAIVLSSLAAAPVAAQIERYNDLQPPDLLELSGHLGKPFPGETGGWDLQLGVGFTPTVYHYHLYHLRVINSGRLGDQILFAVEPERPNFILSGLTDEVAKLANATPDDPVTIRGWRRFGSRILMVTEVTTTPPDTPLPR